MTTAGDDKEGGKQSSFSLFRVKFAVRSTSVVLGFLESRLRGLVFMTYRRNEGAPELDSVVFGSHAKSICDHKMGMRMKTTVPGENASKAASLFGFDLRLLQECSAKHETYPDGSTSFELSRAANENVLNWWIARNSIKDGVMAFTGVDPRAGMTTIKGKENSNAPASFEGSKKPSITSDNSTAPSSSREASASSSVARSSGQPDLRDVNTLLRCRSVIVDLGNACW